MPCFLPPAVASSGPEIVEQSIEIELENALRITDAMRKNAAIGERTTDGTTDERNIKILLQGTIATTVVDVMIGIGAIMMIMTIGVVVMMMMLVRDTVAVQLRPQTGPSSSPFHGIVPGKTSVPIGQISLLVTFGTRENFRTERILFQVADFDSACHAIIGQPTMAKFMVIPHYPYLILKMPGLNGIISLHSDLQNSFDCDVQSCEMVNKQLMLSDQKEIQQVVGMEEQTGAMVPVKKPAKDKIQTDDIQIKEIMLDHKDPDKVTYVRANLDKK
ncbi:hypothetical protein QOZ80_1BG0068960 [Eleusine coracana subsp. coracana]|nr:hypothetical protein QOZ80_1BG0068960 [Eleusine coracana subsp. coracana]